MYVCPAAPRRIWCAGVAHETTTESTIGGVGSSRNERLVCFSSQLLCTLEILANGPRSRKKKNGAAQQHRSGTKLAPTKFYCLEGGSPGEGSSHKGRTLKSLRTKMPRKRSEIPHTTTPAAGVKFRSDGDYLEVKTVTAPSEKNKQGCGFVGKRGRSSPPIGRRRSLAENVASLDSGK